MTFFTADEHYDHRNVLKFCNRPFSCMEEMREALITNHNAKVTKSDVTYHIGDMFWRTLDPVEALKICRRLNGQHFFIWGNHDELIADHEELRNAFVWCKDIASIKPRNDVPKIVLCHYAMRTWNGSHRGTWHLYGHTHGSLEGHGFSFDVGVDANNYAPVSLGEVAAKMKQQAQVSHGWLGGYYSRCIE